MKLFSIVLGLVFLSTISDEIVTALKVVKVLPGEGPENN